MYFKKSIVLSGAQGESTKAVLSVESMPSGIYGSVRLYNFKEEPNGILTLGIMEDGRVHKAGLTKKSPFFYTFMTEDIKRLEKFSTAVVNTFGAKPSAILYGASDGQYNGEEALAACIGDFAASENRDDASNETIKKENNLKIDKVEEILNNADVDFADEVKEEIEAAIDKELAKKPDCASCKYREVFFEGAECSFGTFSEVKASSEDVLESMQNTFVNLEENVADEKFLNKPNHQKNELGTFDVPDGVEKIIIPNYKKDDTFLDVSSDVQAESEKSYCTLQSEMQEQEEKIPDIFFSTIKGEVDKLFEENVSEEILSSIIPNSKWAKVEYEPTGEFYAVGLIYAGQESSQPAASEEETLKYIAYAVPGVYNEAPPKELLGYPVFLPLDENKPDGFGYYISYQDAETGEEVKAKII